MDNKPKGELFEIFMSARGLKNLNNIYLSDTQCYCYQDTVEVGHTEVAKHNLSPDWRDSIQMTYQFHRTQELTFSVHDSNSTLLSNLTELAISGKQKQSYIGECRRSMAQLIGAKDSISRLQLYGADGSPSGMLIIFVDKVKEQSQVTSIRWKWGAHKLLKMDYFGLSDPYAKFYKYTPTKERILVYQSEVIMKTLDPTWVEWDTTLEKLCQSGEYFYVEVWDYDRVGGHDLIGTINIDVKDILTQSRTDFELFTTSNKHAGTLKLLHQVIHKSEPIHHELSFLDYLRGGWQLSMVAAIDFTFSNGPLNRPDSLHEIKTGKLNYYQQALKNVGEIIISFDTDKKVPFYGFGGAPKLPNYTKAYVDDCFPINGDAKDPSVFEVQGLIDAYANAVSKVEFSGPTFIEKILKNTQVYAEENAKQDCYTVALILTDGQIEDMEAVYKVLIDCSPLPISIIIIGVGDDDFSYMKKLDDVEEVRKHAKTPELKATVRDITQFVALQSYQNDIQRLTETILNHLPKQFMDYMHINHRTPKQVIKAQMSQFGH